MAMPDGVTDPLIARRTLPDAPNVVSGIPVSSVRNTLSPPRVVVTPVIMPSSPVVIDPPLVTLPSTDGTATPCEPDDTGVDTDVEKAGRGCQLGSTERPAGWPAVMLAAPVPLGYTSQMSPRPPEVLRKAMRVPSGENAGSTFWPASAVTTDCPVPSAFMMRIWSRPETSVEYAMRLPSGDHVGYCSLPLGSLVRLARPWPSGRMTNTSVSSDALPFTPSVKAMRVPSGDHDGFTPDSDSIRGFEPSAFMIQSASPPPRNEVNTICDPSGDHDGWASAAHAEGTSAPGGQLPEFWVMFTTPDPSAFITYTSSLPVRFEANAIFVPSGDQAAWASSRGELVSCRTSDPSGFIE